MEGSPYTGRTLAIYRRLRRRFDNAGIVLQAYLHRSGNDVRSLIDEGIGHFRLCKGAYDEPATIAVRDRQGVTRAFQELIRVCLSEDSLAKGVFCGVATHDQDVISFARAYAYQHGVPPQYYEFQMLYGIRRELQAELVRMGCPVRVYVAYGTHWYPFYMRRLAERPANLLFFLRGLSGD
jgi:proline dehydrogenase